MLRRLILTPDDHRIARLTAAAIAIALVESAVPSPLPGVKPGLANIVTLLVLLRYDWATAAWVTLLRVLAVSLLMKRKEGGAPNTSESWNGYSGSVAPQFLATSALQSPDVMAMLMRYLPINAARA